MAIARTRSTGAQMSERTPPPRANGALPDRPDSNLKIIICAVLFASAQAILKTRKSTLVTCMTMTLPNNSDNGAMNNGLYPPLSISRTSHVIA